MNLIFVEKGVERPVKAIRGDTLMETAKDNQIGLPRVCGGECFHAPVICPHSWFDING